VHTLGMEFDQMAASPMENDSLL